MDTEATRVGTGRVIPVAACLALGEGVVVGVGEYRPVFAAGKVKVGMCFSWGSNIENGYSKNEGGQAFQHDGPFVGGQGRC